MLIAGIVAGGAIGLGTLAATDKGRSDIAARAKPVAVTFGLMRARAPQKGDNWPGCDPVREAGSAPLYRGEPGYREEMDGDGDGIACEPIS